MPRVWGLHGAPYSSPLLGHAPNRALTRWPTRPVAIVQAISWTDSPELHGSAARREGPVVVWQVKSALDVFLVKHMCSAHVFGCVLALLLAVSACNWMCLFCFLVE